MEDHSATVFSRPHQNNAEAPSPPPALSDPSNAAERCRCDAVTCNEMLKVRELELEVLLDPVLDPLILFRLVLVDARPRLRSKLPLIHPVRDRPRRGIRIAEHGVQLRRDRLP